MAQIAPNGYTTAFRRLFMGLSVICFFGFNGMSFFGIIEKDIPLQFNLLLIAGIFGPTELVGRILNKLLAVRGGKND